MIMVYRYLSPYESMWRIFAFNIHVRWLAIKKSSFHLPNQKVAMFSDREKIDYVLARNYEKRTLLLAWVDVNVKYPEVCKLTYS